MVVETHIYNKRFFDNTLKLEGDSSKAVVEILLKYFNVKSVIDIGCGSGIYLKEFLNKGIDILGYDGAPAALENSLVGDKIKIHDLCKPLDLNRKFDLCLCIEVAEHLPKKFADVLIQTLINSADLIIFTAATPGQGPRSIGHINEQPHLYWIKKFEKNNFYLQEELTKKIKKEMKEQNVVWWIVKNLMIFKKKKAI